MMTTVLMLGSAPMAVKARDWARLGIDGLVAINNAFAIRPDWDAMIHPWDFPADRVPDTGPGQRIVTEADFVPAQNRFGGFVYGGGTMAFTAGYWVLDALAPRVLAVFGCDMHYPAKGPTHFYGNGEPDPLRPDVTLRSLEAKSARLMIMAAMQGTAVVNLSNGPSRLVMPRARLDRLTGLRPLPFRRDLAEEALACEAELGYVVPSGRYWEQAARFDLAEIDRLDRLWLAAADMGLAATA